MMTNFDLILGYDYDIWYDYGLKEPVITPISTSSNKHIICCGMSGSGKSFTTKLLLARFALANIKNEIFFADFKQDDQFSCFCNCSHYYPYKKSLEALDIVYEKMHKRQTNEDKERYPITLIWDEYVANILALQAEDKKAAALVLTKVSEILMLGRSLSVSLVTSCQRPDAAVYAYGSRLNYGILIILGAPIRSIYEMLLPEFLDKIGDREFKTGEGVLLLQGSILRFIKIPIVKNISGLHEICIKALS
jgi:hypothetical protein